MRALVYALCLCACSKTAPVVPDFDVASDHDPTGPDAALDDPPDVDPCALCDDDDPCTQDSCDATTGECRFESLDADGDGFNAPGPGRAVGSPGACGNDCDDTDASAYPGGTEVCDGVDNDCNGVVDDNARYSPVEQAPVQITRDAFDVYPAGLAYDGNMYVAAHNGRQQPTHPRLNYVEGLARDGSPDPQLPRTRIAPGNSDAYGPTVGWTGSVFSLAWVDRSQDAYEVYFNRMDREGNKLGPDLRLTYTDGLSTAPQVLWDGSGFIVAWLQALGVGASDQQVLAQRLNAGGQLMGEPVALTDAGRSITSFSLVHGGTTLGLAFVEGNVAARAIAFRSVAADLSAVDAPVSIATANAAGIGMLWNRDRFVLLWTILGAEGPGDAVWGAAVGEDARVLMPPTRMVTSQGFVRTASLLGLGDRLLLLWGDYRQDRYVLYSKMLDTDFAELTPAVRVTQSPGDSLGAATVFGPDGDVGVLYQDNRDGLWQVYFTRLQCVTGAPARNGGV